MRRRQMLKLCGGLALAQGLSTLPWGTGQALALTKFKRAPLTGKDGQPIKAASVQPGINYLFFYPFRATPCFLIHFNRPLAGVKVEFENEMAEKVRYDWPGGVGPDNRLVAFTAICSHRQSHPEPDESQIRYDAGTGTIYCCSHDSEFAIDRGGIAIGGESNTPQAAIVLEWDKASDNLWATGLIGPDSFADFFNGFKKSLRKLHGSTRQAKEEVDACPVLRLEEYSGEVIACGRGG